MKKASIYLLLLFTILGCSETSYDIESTVSETQRINSSLKEAEVNTTKYNSKDNLELPDDQIDDTSTGGSSGQSYSGTISTDYVNLRITHNHLRYTIFFDRSGNTLQIRNLQFVPSGTKEGSFLPVSINTNINNNIIYTQITYSYDKITGDSIQRTLNYRQTLSTYVNLNTRTVSFH